MRHGPADQVHAGMRGMLLERMAHRRFLLAEQEFELRLLSEQPPTTLFPAATSRKTPNTYTVVQYALNFSVEAFHIAAATAGSTAASTT